MCESRREIDHSAVYAGLYVNHKKLVRRLLCIFCVGHCVNPNSYAGSSWANEIESFDKSVYFYVNK